MTIRIVTTVGGSIPKVLRYESAIYSYYSREPTTYVLQVAAAARVVAEVLARPEAVSSK